MGQFCARTKTALPSLVWVLDWSLLVPFVIASAILVAIPGPAVLYIVSTGIGRGRGAALASMAGIETGALVHVLAATVGVSALLASSAFAFSLLKYAGATYLLYLSWKTLRSGNGSSLPVASEVSKLRAFARGVVVNTLNPKVALFFLAYLPQFVDPDRERVSAQLLVLGLIFVTVAVIIDSVYALFSGSIGAVLHRRPRAAGLQRKVAGITYLALGATAAFTGQNRN